MTFPQNETFTKLASFESKLKECTSDINSEVVDGVTTGDKLEECTQDVRELKSEVKQHGEITNKLLQNMNSGLHNLTASIKEMKESFESKLDACTKDISELKSELVDVKEHGLATVNSTQDISGIKSELVELKSRKRKIIESGRVMMIPYTYIDSTIISEEDKNHVRTWLETVGKTSTPELLYRASIHGWEGDDFHRECDNKGGTLTVIKSFNGYSFGGYLDSSWHSNEDCISSSKAFLFSLHCHSGLAPTKFDLDQDLKEYAAYGNASGGPRFGMGDIHIYSNGNVNSDSYTGGHSYTYPSGVDQDTFRTGSEYFEASEVEVFLVT